MSSLTAPTTVVAAREVLVSTSKMLAKHPGDGPVELSGTPSPVPARYYSLPETYDLSDTFLTLIPEIAI